MNRKTYYLYTTFPLKVAIAILIGPQCNIELFEINKVNAV